MTDVVNLNQFRKQRQRAEKKAQAAENRRKFGRTKAEKTTAEKREADWNRKLDGKKRETPDES